MKIEQIKEISALNSKLEELNAAYCNPDNEFSIYVSQRIPGTRSSAGASLRRIDFTSYVEVDTSGYVGSHRTIFTGPEVKNFLYTLIQQIEQKLRDLGAIL